MKKLFYAYAWLLLSTGIILTSIASIHFFYLTQDNQFKKINHTKTVQISASKTNDNQDGSVAGVTTMVETEDGRAEIVAKFLKRYNSPLKPYDYYGQIFVEIADKNNIDFRLLPSIAMQESGLCKNIPEGSYNCLGFGIHERGTLGFENYEAGFERAAKELKANYIDQGRTTPEEIMQKYTPSSNGSWAESVNQWMAEMRYDDRTLGRELKTNADVLEFAQPTQVISEFDTI